MPAMPLSRRQARELLRRLPVNRRVRSKNPTARTPGRIARAVLLPPTVPAGVERPERKRNVGADYDTAWARSYPARFARVAILNAVMKPVIDLLATPTVSGADRLADIDGPVIFAANHRSHADTPLMMTAIPEPWRNRLFIGAAADYWFTNRITSPLSALIIGAIPVERQRVSRTAIDQSLKLLRDGWSMLIFPEGARSSDGWGRQFTGGAAFLSSHADVPVVPVFLDGTDKVLPKGRNLPRPHTTRVVFGAPLHPIEGEDSKTFTARIEAAVHRLADEDAGDWWTARRRAADATTPSLKGPDAGAWRRAWAKGARRSGGGRRRWPEV